MIQLSVGINICIFLLSQLLLSEPAKNVKAHNDEQDAKHHKLKMIYIIDNDIPGRAKNKPQNGI